MSVDKEVVLGIRPEDIHDEQLFIESSPESVIDARINIYEMLGAEVYLILHNRSVRYHSKSKCSYNSKTW